MTLNELKRIVSNGEGQRLEFKHKINFPEKIAREVVAFANSEGGILLIGVNDDKVINGIKNADEEIYAFEKLVNEFVKFPINYHIEKINIDSKRDVLYIKIASLERKPNFALEQKNHKYGIPYVRVADKSVKASKIVSRILKLESEKAEIVVSFGENEKKILSLIDQNGFTTQKDLIDTFFWTETFTSNLLINLVIGGIVKVVPEEEKEDKFYLKS